MTNFRAFEVLDDRVREKNLDTLRRQEFDRPRPGSTRAAGAPVPRQPDRFLSERNEAPDKTKAHIQQDGLGTREARSATPENTGLPGKKFEMEMRSTSDQLPGAYGQRPDSGHEVAGE